MLKLEGVTKIFNGKTKAIDGIDMLVESGDFVMILGPSGSGKTTLVNLMAGYDSPSYGSVTIDGNRIEGPDVNRGVISQTSTLFPWYNVSENIEYGLKLRGIEKARRQTIVGSILEDIGLSDFADHYPFELSGGMRQRVSLARSLVNNPKVMLLDEPLGALDALTRLSMQRLIHELWIHKQLTCVMITHDIDEALKLGTKIYVLSSGPGQIIKTYYPRFYQAETWDEVELSEDFIEMKKEIMDLIR